jgi:uncharacterized protein (TIRG00374 family)
LTHDVSDVPDSLDAAEQEDLPPPPRKGWVEWLKFALRWTIAIVGVTWVVANLTIRDRVYVLAQDAQGRQVLIDAPVVEPVNLPRDDFVVYEHPESGDKARARIDQLVYGPDREEITVFSGGARQRVRLAGMRLREPARTRRGTMPAVDSLFVFEGEGPRVREIGLDETGGFDLKVPQPLIRVGLASMVRDAEPVLLSLAILVFPITLIATGVRWWRLMRPLGIEMTLGRAYVLNMVGVFYNTFMLGSTGGDFIKAYYAGKHARRGQRAAAWLSVFIDRVIGLVVLVIIGGIAAITEWFMLADKDSAVAYWCLQIAWASAAILLAVGAGLFVALHTPVRRTMGLSAAVKRIPSDRVRDTLQSIYDVVDTYWRHPRSIIAACLLTVPVHVTVIISAMLAGQAFGLPIPWPYYFVCVPVIVLAASMPISPQGAGVMEFFAVLLTEPQGATVSQAFALALSIRAVQILWNLTGGIFVLRGGYSAPAGSDEPDNLPESSVSAAA